MTYEGDSLLVQPIREAERQFLPKNAQVIFDYWCGDVHKTPFSTL